MSPIRTRNRLRRNPSDTISILETPLRAIFGGDRGAIVKMKVIMHAPTPVSDELSAPFWEAVRDKRLEVQRCGDCRRYSYPPTRICAACSSGNLAYEQVSGRGTVFSYSETVSGARHPYFASITPYLVGLVSLEEQEGLMMCSNFPGATLAELSVGARVEVEFQEITPDATIPQFRLAGR